MKTTETENLKLTPRRCPYPYRAMLAICSDLDETPDRQTYWNILRFLNTTQTTAMGPGVGLDVGNSIYFDMPQNQFAYWTTDDAGRHMIRALIKSGHIDCLHSFGDLASSRREAGRALEELDWHGCRLKVWIDHGIAATNFGTDIMWGHGDESSHPAYHADLSTQFGIRYVWRGRVTSVIGQEIPPRLSGLWTLNHPFASSRTLAKEWAKNRLGGLMNEKYRPHALNRVLYPTLLRDGQPVFEFLRANPYWQGVGLAATADGLGRVLTPAFFDTLVEREAVCILYTHLGKVRDPAEPFGLKTRLALARLSERMRAGEILVTTTSRLLDYFRLRQSVDISAGSDDSKTAIKIRKTRDSQEPPLPEDIRLDGLSVDLPVRGDCEVIAGDKSIPCEVHRREGGATVSNPWSRLELPEL